MPPKSKNIKPVDNSNLNGSRIVIEKVPRKSRKSLKSEEGDKVEKTPSVIENISNPKKKVTDPELKEEALEEDRQKRVKNILCMFDCCSPEGFHDRRFLTW